MVDQARRWHARVGWGDVESERGWISWEEGRRGRLGEVLFASSEEGLREVLEVRQQKRVASWKPRTGMQNSPRTPGRRS